MIDNQQHPGFVGTFLNKNSMWQPHRPFRRYLFGVILVAFVTILGVPVHTIIDPMNLVMLYLVIVVIAAIYLGRGPSVVTAVLGVLALDFFFVPPALTFAVTDTQYLLTFAGLLIVGLVISALTVRVREEADTARRHQLETAELYEFTRDLAATDGIEGIMQAIVTHVGRTFDCNTVIALVERERIKPCKMLP